MGSRFKRLPKIFVEETDVSRNDTGKFLGLENKKFDRVETLFLFKNEVRYSGIANDKIQVSCLFVMGELRFSTSKTRVYFRKLLIRNPKEGEGVYGS